ncbi:hypothetical protein AGMMS50268_02120 [Spirochaetia bacterium]|nr:hypothetical protein AGMMS50268_02120 [Spirochaetia bacterium]
MKKKTLDYYIKKVPSKPDEYESKNIEGCISQYVEWKRKISDFYINDKVLEAENSEMYKELTIVKLTENEVELLEREYNKGKKEIILSEDLSSDEYELD